MIKRSDKRGLSTIVATLLIIMLALVAIGIIWVVVKGVLESGSEQISLGKFTLDLEIVQVQKIDDSTLNITVKRNEGEGEFVGINFVFNDGYKTEIVKINTSFQELETRRFELNLIGITTSRIRKISIVPVFKLESGKEITGDIKDEYLVSESSGIDGDGTTSLPQIECTSALECEDNNACTSNICSNNVCSYLALTGNSCISDNDVCTNDVCSSSGTCVHNLISSCCTSSSQCDINQICTGNVCVDENPTGNIFYLSPSGNDNNPGTIAAPFFNLTKAWTVIQPGDTVYIRGGNYRYSSKQTLSGKNGAAGNMINILAYPGETPNISVTADFNYGSWPQTIILFYGDYFHWKGIEISYAVQRVDRTGGFGMWVQDSDNNIFELLNIHHNTNGIQFYGTCTGNLILNCDVHHNQDPYSVDTYGGADGISVGYSPTGTSNIMRGCRMWWNSDDGLDMWNNDGTFLVDNCWSFYNGYIPDTFTTAGNGVGYKYGVSNDDHGSNILITTQNSLAYRNRFTGYHQNGAIARLAFYNNIAYLNNNQGFWLGSFDKAHIFTNNIAYANGANCVLTDESILTTNTFLINGDDNPAYSVTNFDFAILDQSQLLRPRKANGSLPDITFLHLASDSDLIDKGTNVGLPYSGSHPDLGAFEYQ